MIKLNIFLPIKPFCQPLYWITQNPNMNTLQNLTSNVVTIKSQTLLSSGNFVNPLKLPTPSFPPTFSTKQSISAVSRHFLAADLNPNSFSQMAATPTSDGHIEDDRIARITSAIRVIPDFPKKGTHLHKDRLF